MFNVTCVRLSSTTRLPPLATLVSSEWIHHHCNNSSLSSVYSSSCLNFTCVFAHCYFFLLCHNVCPQTYPLNILYDANNCTTYKANIQFVLYAHHFIASFLVHTSNASLIIIFLTPPNCPRLIPLQLVKTKTMLCSFPSVNQPYLFVSSTDRKSVV